MDQFIVDDAAGDAAAAAAAAAAADAAEVDVAAAAAAAAAADVVTLADEVVLLGSPATNEPDSRYRGAVTDTIAHEILTGLRGRTATCQTDQTQGTNL